MANTTTNESGNKLTGAPTLVNIPPNYPVEPQAGKLEDLLLYNEHDIYHKYNPYTENTSLLSFGREQPYIYTYIDEKDNPILPPIPRGTQILQNRTIPIEAGTTDMVRISRFLTSGRGVIFLSKQVLLQAQAKFDETGIYNPLEVPLAVASSTTLGAIPRPQRHINISGGVLGALASIIGINISNGNSAPPSSVGQEALPTFGSTDGKGLLRAGTAQKGVAIINIKWPDGPQPNSIGGKFFNKLIQGATSLFVDTAKAFFPPAFPIRQNGTLYRGDEIVFDRMRSDASGRLTSYNRYGAQVKIDEIRRENVNVLSNNKVYSALTLNSALSQHSREQPYIQSFADSNVSLVDTSFDISGINYRNFRMVRAGAGDGINQIGVLNKAGSNNKRIPISQKSQNYPEWSEWNPYTDDIIAFFFYDIVNEKYIPFRATVKGISDTTTAYWDELRFIGRADQIYTYNGFVRSLAFQFSVVITSLADLLPTWQKLNYMKTSLKPAGYTVKGTQNYSRFMIPPMFTLTIGDMYKYQPVVITNFSINIPENANWETLNENNSIGWEYFNGAISYQQGIKTAQLPKEAEISVTCNLLEKERAIIGGVDFGHAPRGDDGEFLSDEKPFMPDPTNFSKGILVNQSSLKSTISPSGVSRSSWSSPAAGSSTTPNIKLPVPKMDKLSNQSLVSPNIQPPVGQVPRNSVPGT